MHRFFLSALLALVLLPLSVRAQEGGSCDINSLSQNTVANKVGDAQYVSGPAEYRCTGNVVVRADSAVNAFGRLILIGNVVYTDLDKTLRSQRIQYEGRIGRIIAEGHSTVTDRKSGSDLRAPDGFTYQKANRDNPVARIEVLRGRPRLQLLEIPDSTAKSAKSDTTNIDADRMEIVGNSLFRGWGSVVITRGLLNATGGQTVFDDSLGIMDLWVNAHIKGDTYDVRGDSLHAEVEGDLFRDLKVFRNARIDSKDLNVNGVRLRVAFDSGTINRLIALGARGPTEASTIRAVATTPSMVLTADSIDALAPGQELQQVTAVGDALGSRQPDSLDLKLPELIQRDWLRGDTVFAYFIEAPDSIKARRTQSDTTFNRMLDRLIATGSEQNPATATYRIREETDTTHQVEVGYMTALKITALFRDGAIRDLNAEGKISGVYLQPIRRSPDARTVTTTQEIRGRRER